MGDMNKDRRSYLLITDLLSKYAFIKVYFTSCVWLRFVICGSLLEEVGRLYSQLIGLGRKKAIP